VSFTTVDIVGTICTYKSPQFYYQPNSSATAALEKWIDLRTHGRQTNIQGDHSPDNVKFPDNSMTWRHSCPC